MHSNIWGPLNPFLNEGRKYYITFTDEFSRKTWIYFLQAKSEAFSAFEIFKILVDNENYKIIKYFWVYSGDEYCTKGF